MREFKYCFPGRLAARSRTHCGRRGLLRASEEDTEAGSTTRRTRRDSNGSTVEEEKRRLRIVDGSKVEKEERGWESPFFCPPFLFGMSKQDRV